MSVKIRLPQVFAIWLRMNLKESPVFEKVNDSNQPTAKPAPAGSMFQSKSFWLATGLRFGQAGNSGLIQTFLAGYLVQTLRGILHCTAGGKFVCNDGSISASKKTCTRLAP